MGQSQIDLAAGQGDFVLDRRYSRRYACAVKLNEKNIFLFDGIGAALSATTTGLILPFFADWIGFSPTKLRLLGLVGFLFAAYSLTCFLLVKQPKPQMLFAIIVGMVSLEAKVYRSSFG